MMTIDDSGATLINAEAFEDLGGWSVDQQFMDQMGSPFVLAHGLGIPVADARTRIQVARSADFVGFHVFVRTRDWVAPHGPGRFEVQILADIESSPALKGSLQVLWRSKVLGVGNGCWHWEDCGLIEIPNGNLTVCLHDLTGFDGRCDALMFVPEGLLDGYGIKRTCSDEALDELRKRLDVRARLREGVQNAFYDFVVIGGGYAGMCAAVSAARLGVKTALVHDRPVWGGNASSEVRVGPIGGLGLKPFPRNSDLAYELIEVTRAKGQTSGGLRPAPDDKRVEAWLVSEDNLALFKNARCIDVEVVDHVIKSVRVRDVRTGRETVLQAKIFCDATGDGVVGVKAGADYRFAPECREETGESLAPAHGNPPSGGYGATNYWYAKWTEQPSPFPVCPWAIQIANAEQAMMETRSGIMGDYPYAAGWNWENGFHEDCVTNGEEVRDQNLRAAYGMWDFLKNKSDMRGRFSNAELEWLAYILGKRSANRIIGDHVLCEQDLTEHREHTDGVVTTTWFLDMHFPHPENTKYYPGNEFRSLAYDDPRFEVIRPRTAVGHYIKIRPYAIPYRCFYSRNVQNLFMAGKDISATYVGMSSPRVENTTAQMGTMVGRAASLCVKNAWSPRELGRDHFKELEELLRSPGPKTKLMRYGQGRRGIKAEVRYHLRVLYHKMKKVLGFGYLEELAG